MKLFIAASLISIVMFILYNSFNNDINNNTDISDILFITYDAGETNAFIPVYQNLKLTKQYKMRFFAMGTSVNYLKQKLGDEEYSQVVFTFEDLGITRYSDIQKDRFTKIQEGDLQTVQKDIKSQLYISGMVSIAQYQIGEILQNQQDKNWWGYFDGFSNPGSDSIGGYFIQQDTELTTVLTPAKSITEYIQAQNSNLCVSTVGQPSLLSWEIVSDTINKKEMRQSVLNGAPNDLNIITYAGGYGQQYEESFYLYLRSINKLNTDKFYFAVNIHPKVNGDFERQALKNMNMSHMVRIMPQTQDFALERVTSVSQVLVSTGSTAGVQSLFIGVPSLFLHIQEYKFENITTESNLTPNCSTEECFLYSIYQMEQNQFKFDKQKLSDQGIPLDPVHEFSKEINQWFNQTN